MTISVGRFGRNFGNTCCYIITTDHDRTAVVIDPGQGSLDWVHHEVQQRNLTVPRR